MSDMTEEKEIKEPIQVEEVSKKDKKNAKKEEARKAAEAARAAADEEKRKKKAAELRNNIAVGDEITTIGGLTGEVVSIDGDFITFETGEDRVRIEVAKWAISTKGRAANQ